MLDTHQCERVAEENESWRGLWKLICQVLHLREDLVVLWADLLALAIDDICQITSVDPKIRGYAWLESSPSGLPQCNGYQGCAVQMIACGSLARDVPRRNLRNFSFVSGEKEYSRDSDWKMSAI